MYPHYKDKIADGCNESFSPLWILSENTLHLLTWVVAGYLVWPLRYHGWPVATILWALVVAFVQVLLKKHNCSGCYYYGKACHLGWGKLSGWLFKQDSGNLKIGMRLSLFYVISPPLILVFGIIVGIFLEAGIWSWMLLGLYIVLNAITFPVRIRGCRLCAMRDVCPGSAVKSRLTQTHPCCGIANH